MNAILIYALPVAITVACETDFVILGILRLPMLASSKTKL